MNVLLLSHRIPFPPNKGDKIRCFNILKYLSRRSEVHLATLVDAPEDLAAVSELSKHVSSLLYERIDAPWRKVFALRAMLQGGSITVKHFYSRRLQAAVDDLLARVDFDVLLCSSSPMAEYLFRSSQHKSGRLTRAVKIMDLIDVDSYKWRQYAERSPTLPARVYRYESDRLERYERKVYAAFDHVLLVSDKERTYFPCPDDDRKLVTVGNGVDLDYFSPDQSRVGSDAGPDSPTIVFTGMMDYWPNIEGMKWFIESVFPRVRASFPAVRLRIVGGRPGRDVRRWGEDPNIEVTGFVPDVREYVARADVCIAPLRVARGIQNKVLEAMAMGKSVVCTSGAYEGISADPRSDLCVADTEQAFAEAIISLLKDPDRASELGRSARQFAEQTYSWEANLRRLDELLEAPQAKDHGQRYDKGHAIARG